MAGDAAKTTKTSKAKADKKKMYIALGIILVIVLAGGMYYMKQQKAKEALLSKAKENAVKDDPLLDNAGALENPVQHVKTPDTSGSDIGGINSEPV